MRHSLADLPAVLQALFTTVATEKGVATGLIQRRRKLTASAFLQALVFSWMESSEASLDAMVRSLSSCGVHLTAAALQQRFTVAAARFLEAMVEAAVEALVSVRVPRPGELAAVLRRFTAVVLVDSSTVRLPELWAWLWPGCGGGQAAGQGAAAVKANVGWDLSSGRLVGPYLTSGRTHDRRGVERLEASGEAFLPPGGLLVTDLGYFSLGRFAELGASGRYWLSRLQAQTGIGFEGRVWQPHQWLSRFGPREPGGVFAGAVQLGVQANLPARLIVRRDPPQVVRQRRTKLRQTISKKGRGKRGGKRVQLTAEKLVATRWTVLVTNAPVEQLSAEEALVLYGARWQVELLFRWWKKDAGLERSVSAHPERRMCEVYGKLLAVLVAHWLVLAAGGWERPDHSFQKAAQEVRRWALALLAAVSRVAKLRSLIATLRRALRAGCSQNRRRKQPNTYQRLAEPEAYHRQLVGALT